MDTTTTPFIKYINLTKDFDFVKLIYQDIIDGYYINPFGEVYSTISNKILKQDINTHGYKRICLITLNGKRNFSIHRLVAYTFIENPFPGTYNDVNHMDGNKTNNNYDNLEWCNNNQNKHHASINGLYERGEDRYNSVYSNAFAEEICEKFQNGMSYSDVYKEYQTKYPNTSSTIGSFIYKLYHRKTRDFITSKYTY